MQPILRRLLPHFVVLLLFIGVSLTYFSPVLEGKVIYQSDIVQYIGMAEQQKEHARLNNDETYWTNAAFGGMPTYQLGALYAHNYIKKLDQTLRFLPRPADYLFLYFIGIYILLLVLKVNYRLAFLGAMAFGFSTYLIIILGVGHNAKAHAVAYMPVVLSGILLGMQRRYILSFIVTGLGMGLHLVANHFQMTYYLLLLVLCLGVVYLLQAIKDKTLVPFFKAIGVSAVAVVLALGMNATNILATQEYAKESTRGKSELSLTKEGIPRDGSSGLDYEYITEYSYGKLESFNLLVPRLMGGGTSEGLPKDSHVVEFLTLQGVPKIQAEQFSRNLPVYWGDQPIVAAPAYVGAIVIFLAVLSLFLVKGVRRRWLVAGFLLSLFLSWGKNFSLLTDFFINYVPMYNKFRAVSSIQVLLELLLPVMAILGLYEFFYNENYTEEERKKSLFYSTGIVGGILLLFLAFKNTIFSFVSPMDGYFMQEIGPDLVMALREDRAALMSSDTIRSLILVLLTAAVLFVYLKRQSKITWITSLVCVLILIDLVGVDRRYVNNDDFVPASVMNQPYQKDGADMEILKDEGHFRVFDLTRNAFNSTHASYFHNSIGGYHAAKPKRMQEIYDFYLKEDNHMGILNMLNVKYIIVSQENSGAIAQRNPFANGNAWFVDDVFYVDNADKEILALDTLQNKKYAVVQSQIREKIEPIMKWNSRDKDAHIDLISEKSNELVYSYASDSPQVAVFSEQYYPYGWKVYVDGEPAEYFKINYLLRGMSLDAGEFEIRFVFDPEVVKTGTNISLASSILFGLLSLGLIIGYYRKNKAV
ncbi:MAG TPA: hypothetical protein VK050_11905 [Flavobacteriaceae bacterium]|nr:hypothetical protein [Flavobacteriaceae bacterium]